MTLMNLDGTHECANNNAAHVWSYEMFEKCSLLSNSGIFPFSLRDHSSPQFPRF